MKRSHIITALLMCFACTIQISMAQSKGDLIGIGDGIVDGNYIGGLYNYDPSAYTVFNGKTEKPTATVGTTQELIDAVKNAHEGAVIYLKDDASFDLSDASPLVIPAGVTLCSGRGVNKSLGALVFSTNMKTAPMFQIAANNVKITGLRVKGPDGEMGNQSYGKPNSWGIQVYGKNVTIQNCEIFNWSHSGIHVRKGGNCVIDHNYIHHNQRFGLGYGIDIEEGYAKVRGNLFDYNRHAIAGSGKPGTSYSADYNVCLPHSSLQGHEFDMHGGVDRKDGTNVAGDSIRINNNLFFVSGKNPAVRVRGIPRFKSSVYNNSIVVTNDMNEKAKDFQKGRHRKARVKPEAQIVQWDKSTMDVHNNSFYDGN